MGDLDPRLQQVLNFPLADALFGRRSRRFGLGMSIPSGPLAYTSQCEPLPLGEVERALLVCAATGVSGWNFGIPFTMNDGEHLSNYSLRLTGRTGPSATAIHSSELFFTDDSGTYLTRTRDLTPTRLREFAAQDDITRLLNVSQAATVKLNDQRIVLPAEPPHIDEHNIWACNRPGSTLFIPVGNLGEHMLVLLAMYIFNGYILYDDMKERPCGDLEPFIRHNIISDAPQKRLALSRIEQGVYSAVSIELALQCQNIMLMMQAIGLGGWMYTGIAANTLLGAYASQGLPGLGFRFVEREDWPAPNPVGLDGYYESLCPPYVTDMREAAHKLAERKFAEGGTYDPGIAAPYLSDEVKTNVQPYSQGQIDCLGEMAQYIYDTYGRFPATFPTVLLRIYTQAQHLEHEFYDQFFAPGAYLATHADHMRIWHPEPNLKARNG